MTQIIGNIIVIAPEPDMKCELCGSLEETRPYGPNFKRICYDCGMKDEQNTNARMAHKLFGDTLPKHLQNELN